jgi:hypothetical protein
MTLAIIFLALGCVSKLIGAVVSRNVIEIIAWVCFTLAAGALLLAGT